jgi:hypothetical protein
MLFYFRYEKDRVERQRIAGMAKGVGKPKVGGKFELVDQEGKVFTDEDLKGGYSLVSVSWLESTSPEELAAGETYRQNWRRNFSHAKPGHPAAQFEDNGPTPGF